MFRKLSIILSQVLLVALFGPVSAQDETFALTILYANDIHAENEPGSDSGAAREASVVEQIRAEVVSALLLDSSDRSTGALFHVEWKNQDSAEFMNMIGNDAATLDNRGFGNGHSAQAGFLEFPLATADVDLSASPDLAGKARPYVVLGTDDQQIGIIGLEIPEAEILSSSAPELVFDHDLVAVTQRMVDELSSQGVNKIILLAHIGVNADEIVGQSVSGVDVIVSGHSQTQLNNTYTNADSQYPVVLESADGEPVLVVQTSTKTKYLGRLDVQFDANGVLVNWENDTIELSKSVPVDPGTSGLVVGLTEPVPGLCAAC